MKGAGFLKALDIFVIILASALTLVIGGVVYSGESSSSHVVIRSQDKTWVYPSDAETRVTISGPVGETIVEIHEGRTAIVSSPCDGQTCVAAGSLSRNGQWAACLPNRVFVLIEGQDGGDVIDAASW